MNVIYFIFAMNCFLFLIFIVLYCILWSMSSKWWCTRIFFIWWLFVCMVTYDFMLQPMFLICSHVFHFMTDALYMYLVTCFSNFQMFTYVFFVGIYAFLVFLLMINVFQVIIYMFHKLIFVFHVITYLFRLVLCVFHVMIKWWYPPNKSINSQSKYNFFHKQIINFTFKRSILGKEN